MNSDTPSSSSIDISSPLFLSPSDTPGVTLIPYHYQLADSNNYNQWRGALYNALLAKNKQGFVDGSCLLEHFDSSLHLQWRRCNALVLSWIIASVTKELGSSITYTQDAFAVWNDLKERFETVNRTKKISLHNEVFYLTQGEMSITNYYTRLKYLWQEIDIMTPLPLTDNMRACNEYLQQQKLYKFLSGLLHTYNQARTQLLLMSPLPTLNQAYAMLIEEEQRQSGGAFNLNQTQNQLAFVAGRQQSSTTVGNANRMKRDYNIICDYCHKPGHKKAQCYKLVGFPPNFRSGKGKGQYIASICSEELKQTDQTANNKEVAGRLLTEEQYQQLLKILSKDAAGGVVQEDTVNMAGSLQWEAEPDW